MWLMSGKTYGRKNSAPILFINTPAEGMLWIEWKFNGKMDYKPIIYIYIYILPHMLKILYTNCLKSPLS